ncbi:MAG: cob(I)yrinic acid a,c-diamide adenosyltransferase [Provencibacterium sp.]|jgi:cob(I)alamin adenosyltransferase|nr:cob(I)yrinic acid a,c-diamide adenosyltransferase [Provencibacterium sp.]
MLEDRQAGLLHIYTGDGKGKTTAAIGLAVRMCGAGRRVLFAQFLKGRPTAELAPMRQLGIEICRTDPVIKFIGAMDEQERLQCRESCRQVFSAACSALQSGNYGLVILDEVLDAVSAGMLEEKELQQALFSRAAETEAVLTGRSPSKELCQMADYFSFIQAQKHPYERGIAARYGVEF